LTVVLRTAKPGRRLAGFRFEAPAPPAVDVLPRMDVACLVGFAASGPLHTPVAVESAADFADIFGADAPLAWDAERGETAYAFLAPAVRAFFRNGGQRCWVVRVAGRAVSNLFQVPGLAWLQTDGTIAPAHVQARSEGSWSDGLRVSATLEEEVLPYKSINALGNTVGFDVSVGKDIAVGDLLRLTFEGPGYLQFFAVRSLDTPSPSPATQAVVDAKGGPSVWLQLPGGKPPKTTLGTAVWWQGGAPIPAVAYVPQVANTAVSPPTTGPDWPTPGPDPTVRLDVASALADAPLPGTLVRFDFAGDRFWLLVSDAFETSDAGSPLVKLTRLTGKGYWQLSAPPAHLPADPTVERLTFDLWARQEADYPARLSGLGFAAGHPTFWGDLPTDLELYGANPPDTPLVSEATSRRFPLAGVEPAAAAFSFPLAMALFPDVFVAPDASTQTPLERDGLDAFDFRLFLGGDDPGALRALVEAGTSQLANVADFLRYQAPQPRLLHGMYAALAIDELTLIAIPDLVQRGWTRMKPSDPQAPQDDTAITVPPRMPFHRCDARPAAIPVLETDAAAAPARPFFAAADGTFSLFWSPDSGTAFELQEALRSDFSDAVTLYAGNGDRLDIYGHRQGDYYYRLRAQVGGVWSGWSPGLVVRVAPARDWQVNPTPGFNNHTLLLVQRALLRMCAGRGDLMAVLALPGHYREDAAIDHVTRLIATTADNLPMSLSGADLASPPPGDVVDCLPLEYGESATPSFGAIYHPWLIGREETQPDALRLTPPDGAACGIMALRALARGAWVAPANERLTGPVDLSPAIAPDRWLDLLDAQVNLLRDEPRGFLALSADTLSGDDALRPINVRRLLILLRRLALRMGADYVFEPNDAAFHRAVQRSFESMLEYMFARGAFAGATPATSFQVITGSAVNTPQDEEQGRFFVELRVAPSLPLTFMTIRLLQSGIKGAVTEVT
jgi:hypothetical protein